MTTLQNDRYGYSIVSPEILVFQEYVKKLSSQEIDSLNQKKEVKADVVYLLF
jgi:hypothetical protein